MLSLKLRCRRCRTPLELRRTCTAVTLCCRACGAEYPVADFRERIDEAVEESLADIPCDRLS